jgi:hypothetical protein
MPDVGFIFPAMQKQKQGIEQGAAHLFIFRQIMPPHFLQC